MPANVTDRDVTPVGRITTVAGLLPVVPAAAAAATAGDRRRVGAAAGAAAALPAVAGGCFPSGRPADGRAATCCAAPWSATASAARVPAAGPVRAARCLLLPGAAPAAGRFLLPAALPPRAAPAAGRFLLPAALPPPWPAAANGCPLESTAGPPRCCWAALASLSAICWRRRRRVGRSWRQWVGGTVRLPGSAGAGAGRLGQAGAVEGTTGRGRKADSLFCALCWPWWGRGGAHSTQEAITGGEGQAKTDGGGRPSSALRRMHARAPRQLCRQQQLCIRLHGEEGCPPGTETAHSLVEVQASPPSTHTAGVCIVCCAMKLLQLQFGSFSSGESSCRLGVRYAYVYAHAIAQQLAFAA